MAESCTSNRPVSAEELKKSSFKSLSNCRIGSKVWPFEVKGKTPGDFRLATFSALNSNLNANLTNHQAPYDSGSYKIITALEQRSPWSFALAYSMGVSTCSACYIAQCRHIFRPVTLKIKSAFFEMSVSFCKSSP